VNFHACHQYLCQLHHFFQFLAIFERHAIEDQTNDSILTIETRDPFIRNGIHASSSQLIDTIDAISTTLSEKVWSGSN
jgi:hypothetical protein